MTVLVHVLTLALLAKFLWELGAQRTIPSDLFVLSALALPFLLGLDSRHGNPLIRFGVSGAALILFVALLQAQGLLGPYIAVFGALLLVYFFGRLARAIGWPLIAAGTIIGVYLFYWNFGG